MTEHLPECAVAAARPGTFTSCICDELRACEERAIAAAVQRVAALRDLGDAGFTYVGLVDRAAVIDAVKRDQE